MTDTAMNEGPDLLYGVAAIAAYLGVKRRVAYHLIETNRIPHFKVGKTVCARRSAVAAALERRERGVRSRAEYEAKALNRQKPWLAEGISRRTWYRRQRGTSVTAIYAQHLTAVRLVSLTQFNRPSVSLRKRKGSGKGSGNRNVTSVKLPA